MAEENTPSWRKPWITRTVQQNLLGEQLYPLLCQIWKKDKSETLITAVTAGKITGMIIELPVEDVEKLLEDPKALERMYEEAKNLIIQSTPNPIKICQKPFSKIQ